MTWDSNSKQSVASTELQPILKSASDEEESQDSVQLTNGSAFRWKTLGSVLLLISGLIYLKYGTEIRFAEVLQAFTRFSWMAISASFVLALLQCIVQGLRLWALLPKETQTSPLFLLRVFSLGQLANTFLPGRAGDIYKIVSLSQSDGDRSQLRVHRIANAAGSVLIADKAIDIACLITLVLFVAPDWISEISIPKSSDSSLRNQLFFGLFILSLLGLVVGLRRGWLSRIYSVLSHVLLGSSALIRMSALLPAIAFGLTAWALEALALMALSSPFQWQLSFSQSLWVLVVLNIGIAFPISFANLGTFEAAIAFALSRFQVPLPEALALAGVHHVLQIGSITGLVFMSGASFSKKKKKGKSPEFRVGLADKKRAVHHYEKLSKAYDSAVGKGPLRLLREREREAILKFSAIHDPTARTLIDVGCGGGFYALAAKQAGLRVCAVDLASGMIEKLKGLIDESYVSDLDSLELQSQFDIVICSGVLDFVLNPERAFHNLCKLVTPGGRLIIQAPRSGLWGWIYRLEKSVLGIQVNLFSVAWFKEQGAGSGLKLTDYRHPLPTNQVVLLVRELNSHQRPSTPPTLS